MQDLGGIKKDFEIFGKGIQRLEEIKKELKSLNTNGHEEEVKAIESNLNNVSAIPKLENQLEELKLKIAGKSGKPAKIMAGSVSIEKQISELKDLVRHRPVAKSLGKDELEDIHGIPKIDAAIGEMKDTLQAISNRKNSVSKKYLGHISEIPKIEQHIAELKSEIEKRSKRIPSSKIDSGSGSVVQKYFNDMLLNIKYEFSNILSGKKKALEDKNNLELRRKKQELEEKNKALVNSYSKKYKNKVETELKKDVDRRFKEILSREISKKNVFIEKKYNKKFQEKTLDMKIKLNEELKAAKGKIKKEFREKFNESIKLDREKEASIKEKYANLEKILKKEFKHIKGKLKDSYSRDLKNKEGIFKKILQSNIEKNKKEYQEKLSELKSELNKQADVLKNKEKEYQEKLSELKSELNKQADVLKNKENALKDSYSRDLKNKEKIYEEKLEKLNGICELKLKMKKDELKTEFEGEYQKKLIEKENKIKKDTELLLESRYQNKYEEEKNKLKASFNSQLREKENELKKNASREILLKKKQLEDQLKKGLTNILNAD